MSKVGHKGQKVIVGMNEGIKSAVTAYLLKKQGIHCIGVAVLFSPVADEQESDTMSFPSDLYDYNISDIYKVKSICEKLEIPFYAVNAQTEYYSQILDPLFANRFNGGNYSSKTFATRLLLKILIDKMEKLNAVSVALGLLAKVNFNKKTNEVSVGVSNDMENDQSFLLSRLDQNLLSKLYLPLSDMRLKEVVKISNLAKIVESKDEKITKELAYQTESMVSSLKRVIPQSLQKKGEIYNYMEETTFTDHDGVHNFYVGQNKVQGNNPNPNLIDKTWIVIDLKINNGNVYVCNPNRVYFTHALLKNSLINGTFSLSKPLTVFMQFREGKKRIPVRLSFKSLGKMVVDFLGKINFIMPKGELVAFYDKDVSGGRVIGSAQVEYCYFIEDNIIYKTPKKTKDDDDTPKASYPVYNL